MGNQAYKNNHKKLGLCVECSNDALFNSIRCGKHVENHRKRTKRYVKKLIVQGRCSRCGILLDKDADCGYSTCINCREHLYLHKSIII